MEGVVNALDSTGYKKKIQQYQPEGQAYIYHEANSNFPLQDMVRGRINHRQQRTESESGSTWNLPASRQSCRRVDNPATPGEDPHHEVRRPLTVPEEQDRVGVDPVMAHKGLPALREDHATIAAPLRLDAP